MLSNIKTCRYCGLTKSLKDFSLNKDLKDGRANKCKDCHALYLKEYKTKITEKLRIKHEKAKADWYIKNKTIINKSVKEKIQEIDEYGYPKIKRTTLAKFGLQIEDYIEMLKRQNFVCSICGLPETCLAANGKVRDLAIDHCHKTGYIRELLCSTCNNGLGCFKDNFELLKKAIKYLKVNEKRIKENYG